MDIEQAGPVSDSLLRADRDDLDVERPPREVDRRPVLRPGVVDVPGRAPS